MWGARQASAVAIVLPEEKDKGHGTRDKGATGTVLLRCHPGEALYSPTFSHLFDCQ